MRVKVKRHHRGHYIAHLEPHDGMYVGASGDDAAAALHQASKLLDQALANPLVQDVLPPGTMTAVKLLRGATAALRRGNLDDFMASVAPKVARKIGRTLRKVLPW